MNLIDLLDIKEPLKDIKRPKKAMKVIKAKSKARYTMVSHFHIFSPFWDHWDLMEWKMTLVQIPRPERPLKGHLIA